LFLCSLLGFSLVPIVMLALYRVWICTTFIIDMRLRRERVGKDLLRENEG
jgi:hypothetical protein